MTNNVQTLRTTVAEFMLEQRNAGFIYNDGKWIVTQLAELYWSHSGVLRQRRPSQFLGVFTSRTDAVTAIDGATPTETDDRMVRGWPVNVPPRTPPA